jgi:3-oxoacyl-[acyl-carrier-protein] synthase II
MNARRVVLTGCGAISPLGNTADALWDGVAHGRSGIDLIRGFDARTFPVKVAAEVKDLPRDVESVPRTLALAYSAAEEAARQASLAALRPDDRCGVFCGGTMDYPDFDDLLKVYLGERPTPDRGGLLGSWRLRLDSMATLVARRIGIAAQTRTAQVMDNACATGGMVIGEAFRAIRRGALDVAVALGATSWTKLVPITVFYKLGTLSTEARPDAASRPFDAQRSGFVIGEGGGAVVLESLEHALARGATPLAEVTGYGATSSAYRITDMPADGVPQRVAMELALSDARRSPADVDYVNAHGTATATNDVVETRALRALLGDRAPAVPISSTKSMIGHTIIAAGVLEAIVCVHAIRHGVVPPTINLHHPDPDCDLDYVPNVARPHRTRVALSNSFGFAGINCALVIEAFVREQDREQ